MRKMECKRRRGWQRMRWLDSITDSVDMNLSKLQKIMRDRGVWHATVHGVAKSWTRLCEWTTKEQKLKKEAQSHMISWLPLYNNQAKQFLIYAVSFNSPAYCPQICNMKWSMCLRYVIWSMCLRYILTKVTDCIVEDKL